MYMANLNNAISKRSLLRRLDLNNLAGFKTDVTSLPAVVSSRQQVRGEESKCTEPSKQREGGKKIIKITQVKGFERSVMRGFQESR